MKSYQGKIICNTVLMNDENFIDTTIFITEHNQNGAIGFIINKPFYKSLNQLEEFKNCLAVPLYFGGPVDNEHLFFIHQRNDLIKGGTLITNNFYFGGDFKQAITLLNQQLITTSDIKIFIGYCGWNMYELEEEINEGCWTVDTYNINLVFQ
ncbi:MAG TPA: YqgE/AlgH family protein [Chitinophagaceae bacterium]|nr:YqgE/AlgH family protein [Chitinophagaceae bacterium]MCC6633873.1 YqgE/AlgH family protein [Chitinophagaceae bacterium]HMZ47218.1 YqgE/AlgH family protein [Chitinophagaceae bacterium]HNE93079.1 YqgE/AlgH family protein [Chitinophagaceae bacterium]HNJ58444.1 YqgE/AlgH family protein [Chitinophagaceae bacterium]